MQRGWRIEKNNSCNVAIDSNNYGITVDTFCNVDQEAGKISWRSAGGCEVCCECPDGAGVTIDVLVSRSALHAGI